MPTAQTILIVVVVCLTALLVVVGAQVFLAILDLRRAVKRLNSILDDAILGGGLIQPNKLTGILEFMKKKRDLGAHGGS